jgi:NRAMP (natural resistance-associated macrophage protein)-like metal ion transporter
MTVKKKKLSILTKLGIFLAILGPGIVTGSVDNDAGGITTYSVAGAVYGYKLLWTLIPAFLVLVVVQEMNARMGIVTRKGLADLIRENVGVKLTFFIFMPILLSNIFNTTTEFAGVAGSLMVFGISKYIGVPIVAFIVWITVVKGTYKSAERIFLVLSMLLLSYVVSALLGKPDWREIGNSIARPDISLNFKELSVVIGIIGTTIAPWMQFYMQSAVIEKRLQLKDYKYTIVDVVIGSVLTVTVAAFIIIACASTLHLEGVKIC